MKTLEDAKTEGVKENTIYCADCLDVMKLIPDKSIDLIITDPPYGLNFRSAWPSEEKRRILYKMISQKI